jgi:hypothetical protein
MRGSNLRPPPCRGGALPAELIALEGAKGISGSIRLSPTVATWRSGYAAACKAVYTGSIPVVAFSKTPGGTAFAVLRLRRVRRYRAVRRPARTALFAETGDQPGLGGELPGSEGADSSWP